MLKAVALLLAALLHSAQGENITEPYGCGLDITYDDSPSGPDPDYSVYITKDATATNSAPSCTQTGDSSGKCSIQWTAGTMTCPCATLIARVCNLSEVDDTPTSLMNHRQNVICGCNTELCQEYTYDDSYQPGCNTTKGGRTLHYNCSSTAPWPCPADFTLEAAPAAPAPAAHGYDRAGAAPAIAISVVVAALVFMSLASK